MFHEGPEAFSGTLYIAVPRKPKKAETKTVEEVDVQHSNRQELVFFKKNISLHITIIFFYHLPLPSFSSRSRCY